MRQSAEWLRCGLDYWGSILGGGQICPFPPNPGNLWHTQPPLPWQPTDEGPGVWRCIHPHIPPVLDPRLHFASHFKVSEIRFHLIFDGIQELISQFVFYWRWSKEKSSLWHWLWNSKHKRSNKDNSGSTALYIHLECYMWQCMKHNVEFEAENNA